MGPPQPPLGPSKLHPLVKTIREIVDKRRGVRRKAQEAEDEATPSFITARSGKVKFWKSKLIESKFGELFMINLILVLKFLTKICLLKKNSHYHFP
jgi:hypothetical protein